MKVKFIPQNVEFEILPGQSVMHVAQDNGLYIKSVCKGVPSCAECRVRVVEGDHNVLSPGSEELSLIGTGHFIDRRRLSCQLKCFGDITIDLSEQNDKQKEFETKVTKKYSVKDDRVEQAIAIRGSEFETADNEDGEEAASPAARVTVGGSSGATLGGSPAGARPGREVGRGGGQGRNSNRGDGRAQGDSNRARGGERSREQNSQANVGAAGEQAASSEQTQKRSPVNAPIGAVGDSTATSNASSEGGKRRRRRRGRGGGGTAGRPGPGGGAPQS